MDSFSPPRYLVDPVGCLSPEDREYYAALQASFPETSHIPGRDRKTISFRSEVTAIIKFVDRRVEDREIRACATGLVKVGNMLCVNTRQLKKLLHRCKSSINNGLQHLGFTAVKMKPGDDHLISESLPGIAHFPCIARQWTVRSCDVDLLQPHLIDRPASAAPDHRFFTIPILNNRKTLPMPQINTPVPIAPLSSVWLDGAETIDPPDIDFGEGIEGPVAEEPFVGLDDLDFGFSAM